MSGRSQPRFRGQFFHAAARKVVRCVLAAVIAVAVFIFWQSSLGRGFLPAMSRTLWLQATEQASGDWTIVLKQIGEEPPEEPALSGGLRVVSFCVDEHSMGRTNPATWSEWRASTWRLYRVRVGSEAWAHWEDRTDLHGGRLESALIKHIETEIIPGSPAQDVWPDIRAPAHRVYPLRAGRLDDQSGYASWSMWERRHHPWHAVFTASFCLIVGIAAACVVLPAQPSDTPRGLAGCETTGP